VAVGSRGPNRAAPDEQEHTLDTCKQHCLLGVLTDRETVTVTKSELESYCAWMATGVEKTTT